MEARVEGRWGEIIGRRRGRGNFAWDIKVQNKTTKAN